MFDVTLTFDNGPSHATPEVLDLLAEHAVKSTFFVLGRTLAEPSLRSVAERAASQGHWIGNHTYTHSLGLGEYSTASAGIAEIADTQRLIGDLSHGERLFRPYANGGVLDRRVFSRATVDYLQRERFSVVLWNVLPRDWEGGDWVTRAVAQCRAQAWSVVVLHDQMHRAIPGLERLLPGLADAGARFRQDFPDDCVPMRAGAIVGSLDSLVA